MNITCAYVVHLHIKITMISVRIFVSSWPVYVTDSKIAGGHCN